MRLYNKILLGAVALSSMTMTSCLKDQKDLFCDEPSVRLEKRLQECQETLCSSEYGWIMDYYPDRDRAYGGFVYGLKFTEAETTVTCELAPGETETSYYKMTNDNGPILSFDTYNTLMHFFATPSGDRYEAYDGDFEFIILDITPDLITLKGNRTGNTIYMHRATSDIVDYVTKAADMGEAMFPTQFSGTIGGTEVTASNSLGDRYLEFVWDKKQPVGEYYVPTPTGLHFLEPIIINGATFTDLTFDADTFVLSGTGDTGATLTLTGSLPKTYAFYNEYLGNYTINWNNGKRSTDVTIESDGSKSGYIIKGMSNAFDVYGTFDKSNGCMTIYSQQVALNGGNAVWICGWALDPETGSGSFSWSTDCGIRMIKDTDNPGNFICEPTDYDVAANSFIVWQFAGSTPSSSGGGQAAAPYVFSHGNTQMVYLTEMVKK